MTRTLPLAVLAVLAVLLAGAATARAQAPSPPPAPETPAAADSAAWSEDDFDAEAAPVAPAPPAKHPRLEPLVPALAENPYRISDGPRSYVRHFAFSPGFGRLGDQRLFSFRFAFNPNDWLGYEGAIDHNPAQSVHAVQNSLSAILRHPVRGRLQPYAVVGYGMFMVFPGHSLNADPVTKNAVTAGGGLEVFIRDDLAVRGEMRRATVFGREKDREGVVTYDYLEQTIGLTFYRSIAP